MTHPILALQTSLVAALLADSALTAALGGPAVFDAPPKGQRTPYVAIMRHDILPRDGDDAPGNDHRILLHCWHRHPSRKAVLAIAERVVALALESDLSGPDLRVTFAQHDRTDTSIDSQTGQARAAIALRFFTEPLEN
ncbi:DUF3168 domain-containing protein [Mariluticola halotolerans]|uniref:DUF3168 domain-containing protein n=1 Tax=Mariluticola halotolerans TaxID=2909283 RepID=UPI0026E15165|nr:DUF3168 domain-containing protein [Mariluticola halotolerans]UJQ95731.1 DUF3168 domain-containing protein [Mariluticola halotolerans]